MISYRPCSTINKIKSMPTFAIGDIQGCYSALRRLLDKIDFQPSRDKLWLTGDLINRGPESLATLNYIRSLGSSVICILGNHDLHLLAVAEGLRDIKAKDSFHDILNAPNRDEILFWLRQQKLIHFDSTLRYTMVHAGIYPTWSLTQALALGKEVETLLHSDNYHELLPHLYGNEPAVWSEELTGWDRLRFITNVFTRMRYLYSANKPNENNLGLALDFAAKMPVEQAPTDLTPWFNYELRSLHDTNIVFGHWSALQGKTGLTKVQAIDTGYVWGYELTALELETDRRISVKALPDR